MDDIIHLETDVLVAGGGAAGMFAAIAAARGGAQVTLIDKNVVGRGGASIMAQMTCAAALGEAEPDDPQVHLADTLAAGRGLCNERLAALLCEGAPARIRELEGWKVNWARADDGSINQVKAPGHSRRRCVYVDFLSTGAAICAALRNKVSRDGDIRRLSNVSLTDVVTRDGEVIGAVGFDVATSLPVAVAASAVVLCLGGMTKMFARTTSPNNLAGEGLGIALRAGARVIDIEFLQFYPNGHLAPRMVGLDPTTWEPTRVKLGGRLLNGKGEEFLHNYGEAQDAGYSTARDALTYAIYKEVADGRGSPHGGVYLSFQHLDERVLTAALGPVIDIFGRNNIDLTRQPVEVFPIAHYQMGGIEVDGDMASCVGGLYAAGELVGGANGANRLSGNALPEAMVFGARGRDGRALCGPQGQARLGQRCRAAPPRAHPRGARGKRRRRRFSARPDARAQGADVAQRRRFPQRRQACAGARSHPRHARARSAARVRGRRAHPQCEPGRMVRAAQRAPCGRGARARRASPPGKPRRPSARRFSRDARRVRNQPAHLARGR